MNFNSEIWRLHRNYIKYGRKKELNDRKKSKIYIARHMFDIFCHADRQLSTITYNSYELHVNVPEYKKNQLFEKYGFNSHGMEFEYHWLRVEQKQKQISFQ